MIKTIEPKLAAAYLRRSTDRQLQSIPDQRTAVERFARENGYRLVAEYVDDAISGTSVKGRPDFRRLMHDALSANPSFRTVIVYEISRFNRDEPMRAMALLNQLSENGIDLESVSDPLPGSDFDGVLLMFKQTLAHMEVKDTSRRTIRGQVSRARSGCWMGGTPPFGYDLAYLDPKGVVYAIVRFIETGEKQVFHPNGQLDRVLAKGERLPRSDADRTTLVLSLESRVSIVSHIFRLRTCDRLGYRSIAERLNAEGVPSPRNGTYSRSAREGWSRSTIKSLLENPAYVRDLVWNRRAGGIFHRVAGGQAVARERGHKKALVRNDPADFEVVRDAHPAIIDRDTFARAQQITETRRLVPRAPVHRTGRAKASPFLCSGKLRCTKCGRAYIGQTVNKGKPRLDGSRVKTRYYLCGGYAAQGTATCVKAPLAKDLIDNAMLEAIRGRLAAFMDEGGAYVLREVVAMALSAGDGREDKRYELENRRDQIERRFDELVDNLTSTNREFVDRKLAALKVERDQVVDLLANQDARANQRPSLEALVDDALQIIRGLDEAIAEGTLEEKKELVALMVEKVDVDPVGRTARCYIRKFPAPSSLDTGNLLKMVAGAGFEPATFGL
jgi:DNA invertase Pin-like site-specific DNA recombinase